MNKRSAMVLLLALVLGLGLVLPSMAADETAPVCAAPAVSSAPAIPTTPDGDAASALPELSAPVPADPFGGFTPAARPAACPPLAAGCCRLFVPGYPCPMCDGFGCD